MAIEHHKNYQQALILFKLTSQIKRLQKWRDRASIVPYSTLTYFNG